MDQSTVADRVEQVKQVFMEAASPEEAKQLKKYFRVAPGQYGEGDVFLGIRMPKIRSFMKDFKDLTLDDLDLLVKNPNHEIRVFSLLMMCEKYKKGSKEEKEEIGELYLKNKEYVNNWDLVDCSAHIVLEHRIKKDDPLLDELSKSQSMWDRRIAMLATFCKIKKGDFEPAINVALTLLGDKQDLIHKAVGWMLREVGKRDVALLKAFLEEHIDEMHNVTFRYATEKLSSSEISKLKKKKQKL
ncbi:DNA alkylation repair protein [Monocercomonoides exilis]|uniref:DNA alkylation repair protein n=1 Tax=Monocercomonoides exilis TaxID=2049356 RepID=UPI00355A6E88|nr:DNA alkylation repair protein [Monocercomonoides exilis]|eukprot:MONOS_13318.1-p1 / transcript=MONOS_13318.1 / gene=MONOS_13318 / organism=Monocercomonoides_exilis_PA203 / gene_product=DNA alkylation repair protein / transcript_product=DNA alkylation repair protein / location=Mono_scaffold00808:6984-7777(+) / protein_length=243 / sequence_SO=supercontig / SO=protein_coding / is_pseudo=false